ncbi:MAG: aminoacyl-tRNA hydrolase [Flavobacteriaceae bacterium]|nr:aminoacyl-tRNA hydrolase [Flavobacteriaceae bacterium]
MQAEIILRELQFKAVRSSGPGGQHVNKTASKVEVSFNVFTSEGLSASEKERLTTKLANKLTSEGILSIQSSESRSQHRNKKMGIDRLIALIKENLKVEKPRRKTKPSRGVIEKRLQSKKRIALKKSNRKPPLME